MNVYHGLEVFGNITNTVVTIGSFDGVHYGHQRIIHRLEEIAEQTKCTSVVITFWPHPRAVLQPDNSCTLLSDLSEKIALLAEYSIDHLLIIPFDKNFANIEPSDFIKNILVKKLSIQKLVIGYDHRFGRNREGSFEYLKKHAWKFGFSVEEIPKQEIDAVGVSSSKIRRALSEGKLDVAANYLGRSYTIHGVVVKGRQIGRKIGFPTANIVVSEASKLIPRDGIYAVSIHYKGCWYRGMMNIGNNPTISASLTKSLEVNIFAFDQDIYQQEVIVRFEAYIREEQKFSSIQLLKENIARDKQKVIAFFTK